MIRANIKGLAGCVFVLGVLAAVGAVVVLREAVKILMPIIIWLDAAGR